MRRLLIVVSLVLVATVLTARVALAGEIAILISQDTTRSKEIIEGLKAELSAEHQLTEYRLSESDGEDKRVIQEVQKTNPVLVFTVGSRSALVAREFIRDFPVVFTLAVDNPTFNFHTANMTGVNADLPPAEWLQLLKQLYPTLKRIGVVYKPANSGHIFEETRVAAAGLGLEIIGAKIDMGQDIPRAARGLQGQIDLVWMIRDPILLEPDALRELLKFSLIEKLPLLTFSATVVRAGAMLAITPEERGMGRQAARIGKQILAGKRPGQIPVQSPTNHTIALNLATAKRIDRLEDLAINVLVFAAEQKQSIEVIR